MTAITERDLGDVGLLGKAGYEDNDASTGATGENVGVRGTELFGLGTFYLEQAITGGDTTIIVRAKDGGTSGDIPAKLFLGRYIKIGNEIMRVASKDVGGALQNEVEVIRGALGTNVSAQPINSKIRAIEPLPIELRRPSILRASGHTFEYLGYGPGNYSTSLPQLQVRQLPDDEIYLVQAQELSCGQVVYTGMSDNGDFYIGNTKYSATSGTQTTFDVPIPTVAGQLASSNSVVFDEVIINRRLFVAGGETNEVLSQFDGPVKFTQNVTIQSRLSVSETSSLNDVFVNSTNQSTSPENGALVVRGGAGVGGNLYVGGIIDVNNLTVNNDLSVGNDINVIGGDVIVSPSNNVRSNNFLASEGDNAMNLFTNQGIGDITIGSNRSDADVNFPTRKGATGEGGDDVGSAEAGVEIEGGLVVRDVVIAKEFRGDGLGGGPGTILMWAGSGSNPPKNFLFCNGASVSISSYPKLFNQIGYKFGGSGSSFRLPDMRNRFIVGAGSAYSIGNVGGLNTVTLTEGQLAQHDHPTSPASTAHGHPISNADVGPSPVPHGHGAGINSDGRHGHNNTNVGGGNHQHTTTNTNSGGSHSHRDVNVGGGNHGHNTSNTSTNGSHGHNNARTSTDGNHRHTYTYRNQSENAPNGGQDTYWRRDNERQLEGAGNHRHNVNVPSDGSGHNHAVPIPSGGSGHNHSVPTPDQNSGHQHTVGIPNGQSDHNHTVPTPNQGSNHRHQVTVTPNTQGNHEHPISVAVTPNNSNHVHPIGNAGGNQAHENRPPYFALAYIIQFK